MPLGPKMALPLGLHVLHRLILGKHDKLSLFNLNFMLSLIVSAVRFRETMEKILSETTRFRALIFCMKHYLVDLYQVCSNHALKTARPRALKAIACTITLIFNISIFDQGKIVVFCFSFYYYFMYHHRLSQLG